MERFLFGHIFEDADVCSEELVLTGNLCSGRTSFLSTAVEPSKPQEPSAQGLMYEEQKIALTAWKYWIL